MEEVLKRAHVPPRHGVYVERRAMIQKIQEELYKLKDQDGYELHFSTLLITILLWQKIFKGYNFHGFLS